MWKNCGSNVRINVEVMWECRIYHISFHIVSLNPCCPGYFRGVINVA